MKIKITNIETLSEDLDGIIELSASSLIFQFSGIFIRCCQVLGFSILYRGHAEQHNFHKDKGQGHSAHWYVPRMSQNTRCFVCINYLWDWELIWPQWSHPNLAYKITYELVSLYNSNFMLHYLWHVFCTSPCWFTNPSPIVVISLLTTIVSVLFSDCQDLPKITKWFITPH